MRMQKNGVTEEELLKLAAKVNFKVESDEDLLKLYKEARKLGFWPELDRPKLDQKTFWAPPGPDDIRPRKNPWFYPDEPVNHKKKDKDSKMAAVADLERLKRLTMALDGNKLEGVKNLDSWLDDIH